MIICLFLLSVSYLRIVWAFNNATTENIQPSEPKQGWTPQPNGRGTFDIIWTCTLTMSLCSWSITCLNTPGARETKFTVLWRKCALAGLGIVLPEIITVTAVGQWVRARQCVADFNDLEKEQSKTEEQGSTAGTIEKPSSETTSKSKEQWTLDMAFFADMGGFRLRTKNGASFPLDAQQLLYLVRKGYVKQPIFKPRLIDDKNKVDFLLRTIILCQILWFLVGIIGRWAQNLFVTTWEITVVSFVLCSAVTFGFWWYKPADVVLAEFIDIDLDADDILKQEGREGTPWKFTPLDFVSRKEWWWSKAWWAYLNFLHAWHFRFGSDHFRFGSKGEPVDRIADTLQRPLGPKEVYGCLVLATACFSVFFIAWNHDFPTHVEMIFWRTASVAFMSIAYSTLFICELLRILHKMQPGTPSWGLRNTPSLPLQVDRSKKRRFSDSRVIQWIVNGVNKALDKIRNNSPDQDPTLALPLRVMGPLYVIATSYVLFRGYILIQDVIELRQLPASAYKSVEWSNYWPHLG